MQTHTCALCFESMTVIVEGCLMAAKVKGESRYQCLSKTLMWPILLIHTHTQTYADAHNAYAPTHMLSHGLRLRAHKGLVLRGERSSWERSDKNPRLFLCWPGPHTRHTQTHPASLLFFLSVQSDKQGCSVQPPPQPTFNSWSYYTDTQTHADMLS